MSSTSFDIAVIGTWVAFFLSLISLVGVVRAHFTSGTKENSEAIGMLNQKHTKLDSRVSEIETELKHLPSKDDFNQLKVSFAKMEGQMSAMTEAVQSSGRATRRIEEWLIKKGVKE